MNDVSLVGVAVGAVFAQVPLVVIDIALIGVTIRAVLRQIFLIATNVFLVVLDVLLLRGRILALGICTTGEQTGKSNREHTSTDYEFCVHKSSLLLSRCWNYHHTYKSKHLERRKVSPPRQRLLGKELQAARDTATNLFSMTYGQRREPRSQTPRTLRSEEHTSELQSHLNLVCRLLLEKKKTETEVLR